MTVACPKLLIFWFTCVWDNYFKSFNSSSIYIHIFLNITQHTIFVDFSILNLYWLPFRESFYWLTEIWWWGSCPGNLSIWDPTSLGHQEVASHPSTHTGAAMRPWAKISISLEPTKLPSFLKPGKSLFSFREPISSSNSLLPGRLWPEVLHIKSWISFKKLDTWLR